MQSQNLTELMSSAFTNLFEQPAKVMSHMNQIANKNGTDLENKDVPDYLRLPTAEELFEMRQWAIDYKKSNPSESKRQIRKAVQHHFKIKIYR